MSSYFKIIKHYEKCLEKYGDSHLGVDWPNEKDAMVRYKTMLEVMCNFIEQEKIEILDFGCGMSHLYDYILEKYRKGNIEYTGLDISSKFIEASKSKYPNNKYICEDILARNVHLQVYDFIIMNGVFTEKRELKFEEMFEYMKDILRRLWESCRIGMAFNVMSKHVDWEREDLFHLPFDLLCDFLTKEISRDFIIRNDYGLYEYTIYVYKQNAQLK